MKKKEKNRDKSSPAQAQAQAQADMNITDPSKKKRSPRSPLQDLNGITRTNSSTSIEVPRGCLRFFLSNSSSSSKTPLQWPKSLTKSPKSAPYVGSSNPSSSRSKPSKENLPKPTSQRLKKNPPCLYHWQSGKKSTSTTSHKPNPSSANPPINSASGFSLGFTPNQQQNVVRDDASEPTELFKLPDYLNTADVENCTPVGKLACGSALNSAFDKVVEEDSTTTTATKTTTPPVQASVSPEIQCQLSSMLVSESATTTTPACYGAGHHLSGVTDKRKCRPRGILTVGDNHLRCGTSNDFDTENVNDFDAENAVENKSRLSLVPLPAEALMHWLGSPCDEEDKHQKSDTSKGSCQIRKLLGSASTTQHLSSSPSAANVFPSYVCDNANCSSIITKKNASKYSRRRSRITLFPPSGLPEFQGFLGPSSLQASGCLSSPSTPVTPSCEAVISQDNRKCRYDSAGASSLLSTELLSSGNVIQTPQSDSSSDKHVGLSWLNADDDEKQYFDSEVDVAEECLGRVSLSPKSQTLLWDLPGPIFPFTGLTSPSSSIDFSHFQETWDNSAYCIPDSTLDNVSQSHIRISWRDGLMSRLYEMDELDFCKCLSDDENDANQCRNNQLKSHPSHELNFDLESGQIFNNGFGSPEVVSHDENDANQCRNNQLKSHPSHELNFDLESCQIFNNGFGSPVFIGHDRRIDGSGKENNFLQIPNSCAESICTDGGGLVASGDSDWTLCYKNLLFEQHKNVDGPSMMD